jgi:hypothetical protein
VTTHPDIRPTRWAALAEGCLSGVKSTTVVDPLTVKVTFQQPNAQFLQATSTHSLGIESSASVKRSPQQRCSQGAVGSRPFVLKSYVQNQSITLAKRTGYAWGSSLWHKSGGAYLDKVVFKVVPEAGVRAGSLQSAQVDAISSVGKADEAALKGRQVTLQRRASPGVVFGLGLKSACGRSDGGGAREGDLNHLGNVVATSALFRAVLEATRRMGERGRGTARERGAHRRRGHSGDDGRVVTAVPGGAVGPAAVRAQRAALRGPFDRATGR